MVAGLASLRCCLGLVSLSFGRARHASVPQGVYVSQGARSGSMVASKAPPTVVPGLLSCGGVSPNNNNNNNNNNNKKGAAAFAAQAKHLKHILEVIWMLCKIF